MSREKQIIEIKECIDAVYGADCAYFDVDGFAIANEIYNAGYRKQSENVIELPCKIGDTIYLPWEWNGQKGIACLTVTVLRCIVGLGWSFGTDFDTDDEDYYEAYNCGSFKLKDFGKIVFLSREEAEQALAKMKGGE